MGGTLTLKTSTDPGWQAIAASEADLDDPELVVLSASSYGDWLWCPERFRLLMGDYGKAEESFELMVGSCYHKGVAEIGRQLMEAQRNETR